jgi:hypothetical protein
MPGDINDQYRRNLRRAPASVVATRVSVLNIDRSPADSTRTAQMILA